MTTTNLCGRKGAALLALVALAGCMAPEPKHEEAAHGSVTIALSGGSSSGALYRLRDGLVDIMGPSSTMFSSEDHLGSSVVTLDLLAGPYLVMLHDGWRMERSLGGMVWEDVEAQLISENPQPFDVFDQGTTHVVLRFRAGGEIIEMGYGRVHFSLFVEDGVSPPPPPPGECAMACADAAFLGCLYPEFCEPICSQLTMIIGDPACEPQAQAYMDCAAGVPGMDYTCHYDYPIAAPCLPIFDDLVACLNTCTDNDGDGSCVESGDCNDGDPSVFPGAAEICGDMIDNNCNGVIDDCPPPVPPGWTCDPLYYGVGDGCDCGCGVLDPDCPDSSVGSCVYCDDPGSCSEGLACPGSIHPMNNAICL